jgi:uroporphyrinogen-III decarboxylase
MMDCCGTNDTYYVGWDMAGGWQPEVPGMDEWGCVWEQTETANMGQVKGHPLADVSKLGKLVPPDYTDDARYANTLAQIETGEKYGRYVMTGIFMVLFERMHALHGFENTLVDLYYDRPNMEKLADIIADAHVTLVREMARRFPGRLDAWQMSDDWGTQQAAFISFDLWMDFFYPRYKRIFDAMHEAGCDVWVHSCGKVNEIIEGYIRAGVNVVNLQQPRALGIEEIGSRYRGRIAFQGLADIQATLPTGDRKKVDEDVDGLMSHWASDKGGFICSDYGSNEAIGVSDPTIKGYMYEAFSEWSKRLYGSPLPPQKQP